MNMLAQLEPQKTMSHREVAELTQKEPKHVKRDCEVMFKELGLSAAGYAQPWTHPQNGQTYIEYMLPRDLVETLITGYNIKLRHAVLNRLRELEAQATKPTQLSRMDLIQLALQAEQENQELRSQVAILEPKAKGLDRIADCTNVLGIRESAKVLKIGQNQLTQYLIDHKVVYRDQYSKIQAYQKSIDQKLVHVVTSAPRLFESGEKVFTQVKLTQKLITRIAKWLEQGVAA